MSEKTTTRRQFLRTAGQGALAAGLPAGALTQAATPETKQGGMPYRTLGKTGERVSLICLGGYHMGMPKDEGTSIRIVHAAIDAGINFLDNAWKYNGGRSEERMGKALRGKRDKVFLMTKSDVRDKKGAMRQLEQSLRRLQTDYLDLWQVHEIAPGHPKRVFAPGGAIEAWVQARKQGKIRYIGFTGHENPKGHLEMLSHDFAWDTVQIPLNPADPHYLSFETQVLPELIKRKIGVIAMKTLGFGALPKSGVVTSEECWHYVMSLPVSTVCTGCESIEALNRALAGARSFKPLTDAQRQALLARTKDIALKGKHEHYKRTARG